MTDEMTAPPSPGARLALVAAGIEAAEARAGRPRGSVRLLAVSKTFPGGAVLALREAGQLAFGENYIQEAREKIPSLPTDLEWHFIGHLQTNKAKYAAGLFDVVHTLDSLDLASELDGRLERSGRTMRVFLQVNVSGEGSKSGMAPAELPAFLEKLSAHRRLIPEGLMTMPPYDPDPEVSRPHFARLRELRDAHCPHLPGLSMGMSDDYPVAISEGATVVRIGTALFGDRARR